MKDLKDLNIHERDKRINFNEEDHIYIIDGNKNIFILFNWQWEATLFKSGSKLNAPLIPMYVANIPCKAHKLPSKK